MHKEKYHKLSLEFDKKNIECQESNMAWRSACLLGNETQIIIQRRISNDLILELKDIVKQMEACL